MDGREGVQVGEREVSPGRPAAWTGHQGNRLHSEGPEGPGQSGVTLQSTAACRLRAGGCRQEGGYRADTVRMVDETKKGVTLSMLLRN